MRPPPEGHRTFTVEVEAWERCRTDRDPTACATATRQTDACGVQETLRARCPLYIKDIFPDGPAARAGLHAVSPPLP